MKVVCIVQARMGSERLPGKVMKRINNIPLIGYTLKRLKKSKYIDEIVLATTIKKEDDVLVNYVEQLDVGVFRGSEIDVLERYIKSSEKYNADIVIRVTGDCPFVDSYIVDNVISKFLMENLDYIRLDVPDSFIRGFDVEVFKKEILIDIRGKIDKLSENERIPYIEHVTYYIYTHKEEYKTGVVKGSDFYSKNYRICVDTIEDFNLVEDIISYFNNIYVSAKDIIKYIDDNKELSKKNEGIKQKIVN